MSKTFASIVSPPGAGGISIIEVWGDRAVETVQGIFQSKGAELPLSRPDHLYYGTVSDDQGVIDEALCVVSNGVVEVTTHGGVQPSKAVLNALENMGVQPRWNEDASDVRPTTPLRQAAAKEIPNALTWPAARMLLDQVHGAIDRELIQLMNSPERERVNELLSYGESAKALLEPTRILLAGSPNVGKSTLFNALCEEDRVLVSDVPGTTRDAIEERVAWGGFPVLLMDSAGLRESTDPIEQKGVARALAKSEQADLVCFLFDGTRKATEEEVARYHNIATPVLPVVTKADLPQMMDRGFLPEAPIQISAATREGLEYLQNVMVQRLAPHGLPPIGAPVPFPGDLQDTLLEAGELLDSGNVKGFKECLERWQPQS